MDAWPCCRQWRTTPRILFTLPADAFTPRPKVESAVVEFVPEDYARASCDVSQLEKVTAAAFGQRRKMLRASLRQITPDAEALLERLGIDPKARAEELPDRRFLPHRQCAWSRNEGPLELRQQTLHEVLQAREPRPGADAPRRGWRAPPPPTGRRRN